MAELTLPTPPPAPVRRPAAHTVGRRRIVSLTVIYEDGDTVTFVGSGSLAIEHTSTHRNPGKPNDVHYAEAILKYDPDSHARRLAVSAAAATDPVVAADAALKPYDYPRSGAQS